MKQYKYSTINISFLFLIIMLLFIQLSCNSNDKEFQNIKEKNQNLVANAGPDKTNVEVGSTIMLDGSKSSNPNGDSLFYYWLILDKPQKSKAVLSDPNVVNPTILIDEYGLYRIQLYVKDDQNDSKPDTIEIITSDTTIVPDVSGVQLNEAQNKIVESDLILGKVNQEDHETLIGGCIIKQSLFPGTYVLKGTTVDLTVSTGIKPIAIPDVLGMSLSEATYSITSVELILGEISYEESTTVPEGKVIKQYPMAGTSSREGGVVHLVISQKSLIGKVLLKDDQGYIYEISGLISVINNISLQYDDENLMKRMPLSDKSVLNNYLNIKIQKSDFNQSSMIQIKVKYKDSIENIILYDRVLNQFEFLPFILNEDGNISFQIYSNRDISFLPIKEKGTEYLPVNKNDYRGNINLKQFEILVNNGKHLKIKLSNSFFIPDNQYCKSTTSFNVKLNGHEHSKDNILTSQIIDYEVDQSGLYEFSIYMLISSLQNIEPDSKLLFWEQQILVQTESIDEIQAQKIAEKYSPILIFHDKENFFPSSLDYIFNNDALLNFSTTNGKNALIAMNKAKTFMANNGHCRGLIDTNEAKETLKGMPGNNVVYYSLLLRDNKYFLNYHFFYTYDEKPNKHIVDHAFDRESITLVFNSLIDGPESIIYAAHLSIQHMSLQSHKNEAVQEWDGGRVKVKWKEALEKGYTCQEHPLVCVARGSHGLFPVCGQYLVKTFHLIKLLENAGGKDGYGHTADWTNILISKLSSDDFSDGFSMYDLKYLDLGHITSNNEQNAWLAFSGGWIEILFLPNAKFPPFTEPLREIDPVNYASNTYSWDVLKVPRYSKKLMMEIRQKLGCQLENEEIAWTGKTDILGRNIVDISYQCSVNDNGYISFIGKIEKEDGLFQNIFVIEPYDKKITPMLIEIFEYPEKYEYPQENFVPRQTFDYPIINNNNQVISRRFLKAQVAFGIYPFFQYMEMPMTCLELWNSDGAPLPIRQIASGTGGWSSMITFINPVTASVYPSPYYPLSPWDGIYWNYSINNNGSTVYTALRKNVTYISTPITPPYKYNNIKVEAEQVPWVQLSDSNSIIALVGEGNSANLYLSNFNFSSLTIIAGAADGKFSYIGKYPSISDNGQFISFFAIATENDNENQIISPGPGIFLWNSTTNKIYRLCGLSGNGQLDPGETYIDINENGIFDANIDKDDGIISSIYENTHVCVNNKGTVVYCANNDDNKKSIIVSRIIFQNNTNPDIHDPLQIQSVGDIVENFNMPLSDLKLFDSLSNQGEYGYLVYWAEFENIQSLQEVKVLFEN